MAQKLTDRAELLVVPADAWIHVVDPSDTTDSPEGTSFKAKISAIPSSSGVVLLIGTQPGAPIIGDLEFDQEIKLISNYGEDQMWLQFAPGFIELRYQKIIEGVITNYASIALTQEGKALIDGTLINNQPYIAPTIDEEYVQKKYVDDAIVSGGVTAGNNITVDAGVVGLDLTQDINIGENSLLAGYLKFKDLANGDNDSQIIVGDTQFQFSRSGNRLFAIDADGGFMSYKSASEYASFSPSLLTDARVYQLPDASGTIALTSDLAKYEEILINDVTDSANHTGTTTKTILRAYEIPADLLASGDALQVQIIFAKNASASPIDYSIDINTSNTLTSAVTIAKGQGSNANRTPNFTRTFTIESGNLKFLSAAGAAVLNGMFETFNGVPGTTPYNTAAVAYFIISAALQNAADSTNIDYVRITRIKGKTTM